MDETRFRAAERALWAAAHAEPTERWLQLGRTTSTVRVQELGAGPPAVFVHGASNAGTSWASLAARLPNVRCILVDRPGAGLSPPLGARLVDKRHLDAFADDVVVDVLDALELESAHVVGTSFGGYFALRGAAAHPDRFMKLVVLGWTFGAPVGSTPLVMRIATQPLLGRLMLKIRPNERMVRSLLKQIGLGRALESGAFGPVEIEWYLSLLRDTDTMRNEIGALPRIITMRGFNDDTLLSTSLLERVTAPVLLLWGAHDPMGGVTVARQFASQLPDAELEVMNDAGHAPWIDDADHVAERIGGFLRR